MPAPAAHIIYLNSNLGQVFYQMENLLKLLYIDMILSITKLRFRALHRITLPQGSPLWQAQQSWNGCLATQLVNEINQTYRRFN